MNKENAKKFLPIIQALADGEEIECKCIYTATWKKQENICFDEEPESYRIKPEPRTFEIVRSKLSCGSIYDAETWDGSYPEIWERITVQEVLK
jgi:hypothetical protein